MVSAVVNVARYTLIFLVMLAVAELGARVVDFFRPSQKDFGLEMGLQPYVMFTVHPGVSLAWTDMLKEKVIEARMKFNNLGFAEENDFSFSPEYDGKSLVRKPGEKLVVMTGGSAVYGVGATTNEYTAPSQVERYLNAHSKDVKYRVLNMGMGAWNAYQEFIGLSLFARRLEPDWVVVMDGRNDGVNACGHGNGVGNPLGWAPLLNLVNQRGGGVAALISEASNYSALVRLVTGKKPELTNYKTDKLEEDLSDPQRRFRIKVAGVTIEDQLRQLEFYINAELNIASLFNKSNIIFSTQPLYYNNTVSASYRSGFGPSGSPENKARLKADLDTFASTNKGQLCTWRSLLDSESFFMGISALRLSDSISELQEKDHSRHIIYENAETVFPFDWHRKDYFIDDVHLSDTGNVRLGSFFGEMILSAERGEKFDYKAFMEQHKSGE
jgi:hypothetical protein